MDPEAAQPKVVQRPELDVSAPAQPAAPQEVVHIDAQEAQLPRNLAPQVTAANDGKIVTPEQTTPAIDHPIDQSVNKVAGEVLTVAPQEGSRPNPVVRAFVNLWDLVRFHTPDLVKPEGGYSGTGDASDWSRHKANKESGHESGDQ